MEAGLYIHIPFCLSKCSYCDFFSVPQNSVPDSYVEALVCEIKEKTKGVHLKSVYMGGGTPSLLTKAQIERICDAVFVDEGIEFTMEVNPDDVTQSFLETVSETKISRISCGIQSFYADSLSYCKRRSTPKQNEIALELFEKYWKGELSLDLICAMPKETISSMKEGILRCVGTKVDHISFYSLTIEDETPLGKACNAGELEYDFDVADEMWLEGRSLLESKGFNQYEVSNFAKPGHECRHNLIYWNHENYLGCGAGAVETVYNEDGSGIRRTNTSDIKKYVESWKKSCEIEEIPVSTSIFEYFMMGLRKTDGIWASDFERKFGKELPPSFIELMKNWEKKGLASVKNGHYNLSKEGLLHLNTFLSSLDFPA